MTKCIKKLKKNPIRLAIKKDNALTFQSLLSKSNLSVNATVTESIVEHFLRVPIEIMFQLMLFYMKIKIYFFFSKDQPEKLDLL